MRNREKSPKFAWVNNVTDLPAVFPLETQSGILNECSEPFVADERFLESSRNDNYQAFPFKWGKSL